MFGNIVAVTWKELQLLFRDRGALVVLFLLPLLFASILGGPAKLASKASSGAAGTEPVLVFSAYLVNQDSGAYGAQVTEALQSINALNLTSLDSADQADGWVAEGKKPAAIVIPVDFSSRIDANQPTTIRVIGDPTQEETVSLLTGIVNQAIAEVAILGELRYGIHAVLEQSGMLAGASPEFQQGVEAQTLGVIWTQIQEMRQNPLILVESRDLVAEDQQHEPSAVDWYIPSFTVMFAFFLITYTAKALLLQKEEGSFRRLVAAPISRGEIIASYMIAYAIVVFLQVTFMFSVGHLVFEVPLGNSPVGLLLVTLATALAASSLGLLVGAVAKTSEQADSLAMALGFVLMIVGGCVIAWFTIGGVAAFISNLTPHAHALQAYRGLMIYHYGVMDVLPHILALFGFAGAFFAAAMWRFKFT